MKTPLHSAIFGEYRAFPEGLELIAVADASESYEIDVAEIYLSAAGGFTLITASGCSCWEGEYERHDYTSLDELAADAKVNDTFKWLSSCKEIDKLVADAKARLQ